MALKSESYYRGVATTALDRFGVVEPPIPVEALIASVGVPVRPVNLPAFFTGAVVSEDGLPVIVINWAKPEPDRRRALAHMLGHVLLMLDDPEYAYPRTIGDHPDAETVAEELMMPTKFIIEQARLWFNDYRYLARMFGVEEDTMLARMRDLGLVRGPEGVMWDY